MRVRVKLFARARDLAKRDEVWLDLPEGATVGLVREKLGTEHPVLKELLNRCAMAVAEEFAQDDLVVRSDQEVAVLPPVSGG